MATRKNNYKVNIHLITPDVIVFTMIEGHLYTSYACRWNTDNLEDFAIIEAGPLCDLLETYDSETAFNIEDKHLVFPQFRHLLANAVYRFRS